MKKKLIIIISSSIVFISLLTVLIVMLTRKKVLDTPYIWLNDKTVGWTEVSHASSYDVYVNDTKENIKETSYTLNIQDDGDYNVYVVAVSNKSKYKNSKASNTVTYSYHILERPNIYLEDRLVKWYKVDYAIRYEVLVDGEHEAYTTELSYKLDLDTLTHNITVIALGNDNNIISSSASLAVEYKQLAPPTLSKEGNYITWPQIENSNAYIVYVDGTKMTLTDDKVLIPSMIGLHEFKVAYKGINGYATSNYSTTFYVENYEKLDSVTNIKIQGDYIIWDPVSNAIGYDLEISDGTDVFHTQTQSNKFNYKELDYGRYSIRIMTLGNDLKYYLNSDYSYTFDFKNLPRLDAPVCDIVGNIISWNVIEGAIGYSIYNNGEPLITGINDIKYDLRLITDPAYYELTVVANGDYINNSDSLESNVCSYLVSNRLETPTFSILNKNVTINSVDNASGYYIYIDGVRVGRTDTNIYSLENLPEGEYIVTVSAFNEDKNLFQDSYESYETRCIIKGVINEVSDGIVSFDNSSYLLDSNAKGITVDASNTPQELDSGYEYNGVTYTIGYAINNLNTIKVKTLSKTTIQVIYKGFGNGGIKIREVNTLSEYEIIGVTSVGVDISTSLENILEGEYEIYSTEDAYILAIIIDAREDEIDYIYSAYDKKSYKLLVESYDMNEYDSACVKALSLKRDSIVNLIELAINIVDIEALVNEFNSYAATVVKSNVKNEVIEYVTKVLEEEGKTSDEIATVCNNIRNSITMSEIDEILYENNINN